MQNAQLIVVLALAACAGTARPAATPKIEPAPEQPTAAQAASSSAGTSQTDEPLLPNAREPLPGVITGGAPSQAQLRAAQRRGYRTVISLLPDAEGSAEAAEARRLGLEFVSIPVPDASGLTKANAERLAAAMDAEGAKPMLLHCASGNRTGALLALRAFYVDHASPERALELGASGGMTSLRPVVEAQLKQAEAP